MIKSKRKEKMEGVMLYILRENGLKRYGEEIIDRTRKLLRKYNYNIVEQGFVQVKDKEKMIHGFYSSHLSMLGGTATIEKESKQKEQMKDAIWNSNGMSLYYIVTNYSFGAHKRYSSKDIKKYIRKRYCNEINPYYNYIHSSDDCRQAEQELSLLKNTNICNFNMLGSTYKMMSKNKDDGIRRRHTTKSYKNKHKKEERNNNKGGGMKKAKSKIKSKRKSKTSKDKKSKSNKDKKSNKKKGQK
jgi:hypothetical protein